MEGENKDKKKPNENNSGQGTRIEVTLPAMPTGMVPPVVPPSMVNPYNPTVTTAPGMFGGTAPGFFPGIIPAPAGSPNIIVSMPGEERSEGRYQRDNEKGDRKDDSSNSASRPREEQQRSG